MKGRKSQKDILFQVMGYIRRYWIYLGVSILMAALTVALTLYLPILTGDAIDLIIGKGLVDFQGIMVILEKMAIAIGVTAAAQWLMNVCNNKMTYGIVRDIRNEAFRKIEKLPLKYIDSNSYGEVVSRVIADVDQFADGLLMGFTQLFTGVVTIFGTLAIMLTINIGITAVVVCITPVSFLVANFIAKKTFHMFRRQSETRAEQTALIDEMVGGQRVVQAFGYEENAMERFDEINERLQKCSLQAIFFSSITNPATRFVNSLVYTGVGITGALFAIRGGISVGMLSCLLTYANQYTKPFNEISGVITELQNALACAGRIFELMEEEPQIPDAEDALELKAVRGNVTLENVSFSYVPDKKLIRGFNLSVKPGQRVAIVGPTGCGKTTIINLLMRFYDVDEGSILVEGRDNRDYTRRSLRGAYAMVLQDTWVFKGTIFENIAYGKEGASRGEVVAAAKAAHIHSFIMRLPQGYETVISEDGGNISKGQKQLLTIARAMLYDARMLILDEATSNVDTGTERRIQKAMRELMKDKTCFVIAHRLSTIQNADYILVVDKGDIVEQGNHESLMERKGFYYKLYAAQFE